MMRVLSNLQSVQIRATFSSGMSYTALSDVVMDTAVPQNAGQSVKEVEECRCPEGYRGLSCEVCFVKVKFHGRVKPEAPEAFESGKPTNLEYQRHLLASL